MAGSKTFVWFVKICFPEILGKGEVCTHPEISSGQVETQTVESFPGFTLTDSWTCAVEKTWLGVVKPFGCHRSNLDRQDHSMKAGMIIRFRTQKFFFGSYHILGTGKPMGEVAQFVTGEAICLQGANLRCSAIQWAMKLKIGSISIPLLKSIKPYQWELLWLVFPQDRQKKQPFRLFHSWHVGALET